jgi:hypothetical protein
MCHIVGIRTLLLAELNDTLVIGSRLCPLVENGVQPCELQAKEGLMQLR